MGKKELKERIKVLLNELYSNDETVRLNSANASIKIGAPIVPYLKEINKHIESDNEDVSREIARILVHIGEPAVPSLLELLDATAGQAALFKKKRVSIQRIIDILAWIGQPAVPGLRNMLKRSDGNTRVAAAMVLRKIDYPAHEQAIIQVLIKGLNDKYAYVRQWAIDTCMTVLPQVSDLAQQEAIMLALLKRLYDGDDYVLEHAIEALIKIGKPAVLLLIKMVEVATLTDYGNTGDFTHMIMGLVEICITKSAMLPARILTRIGQSAIPELSETLKNNYYKGTRIAAALILGDIGHQDAIPVLGEVANDDDEQVARASVIALSKLGKSAVPILFQTILTSPKWDVRELAERYLVNDLSMAAVPVLCEEIRESKEEGCKKAVELLGKIGDRSALPSLKEALNYLDEEVKKKAVKAINKIEKK